MQWLEFIYKFITKIKYNCFRKKYKTKNIDFLIKLIENENKFKKWQLIDTRNKYSYIDEGYLKNSINVHASESNYKVYKKIDRTKNILIISSNYRSNLELYKLLKSKRLNVYILEAKVNEDVIKNKSFNKFIVLPH